VKISHKLDFDARVISRKELAMGKGKHALVSLSRLGQGCPNPLIPELLGP